VSDGYNPADSTSYSSISGMIGSFFFLGFAYSLCNPASTNLIIGSWPIGHGQPTGLSMKLH
jgi:hypothetical protein